MSMKRVIWEIDIDAETSLEAAQKALQIQRDSGSIATFFVVVDGDERTGIDLDYLDKVLDF